MEFRYTDSMMVIKNIILTHYYFVIIATGTMSLGAMLVGAIERINTDTNERHKQGETNAPNRPPQQYHTHMFVCRGACA